MEKKIEKWKDLPFVVKFSIIGSIIGTLILYVLFIYWTSTL